MSTKSRQYLYGASVRFAAERAKEARKVADRVQAQVSADAGRPADPLQSIRGGIGEFALDAKVAARLR